MLMPERKFDAGKYRYGFNGKENDNDVKGEGNQQDYGMRISDARLGRFLSVDPITNQYPELIPFQFASNTPIQAIDLDGLEAFLVHGTWSYFMTWSALSAEKYESIYDATGNKKSVLFDWEYNGIKGPNIDKARQMAGEDLADMIISIHKLYPDEPITIVGHSHGGNVAIITTNILQERGYKVNYLITINTPVREYQLNSESQKHTKHFNIYDPNDPIQAYGGNKYKIFPIMNGTEGTGEFGPTDRTFENSKNFDVYHDDSWYEPRSITHFFDFSSDVHNTHNKPELWGTWLYNMIQGKKKISEFQNQQDEEYKRRIQTPGYVPTDETNIKKPIPIE